MPVSASPKKADFTIADEATSKLGDKGRLALAELLGTEGRECHLRHRDLARDPGL